ncbi:hypothetical protein PoB_005555600 [Plakobranchus ocellatus]|uniref:Uncharacterized protein n=1 Tax=Plakobranchus ocellatus TaxID=259542 RepID=A0AAV4C0Z7_9GAST|nr:hypothetical protein PoB_005555600 [Plakobranchus ocellatus]
MAIKTLSFFFFFLYIAIAAGQMLYGRDNLGLMLNYNDFLSPLGAQNMPPLGLTNTIQALGPRQRVYRIRNVGSGLRQHDLLYDSSNRFPMRGNILNNYGISGNAGRVYDVGVSSVPYDPVGNLIYRAPLNGGNNVPRILL